MKKRTFFYLSFIFVAIFILLGFQPQKAASLKQMFLSSRSLSILNQGSATNISNTRADSVDPEIVAGNNGKAYVVWVEAKNPKELWFNSNENGNWGNSRNVSDPISIGTGEGGRPSFVIDSSGRAHYVMQAHSSVGDYDIFYNSVKNLQWSGNEDASLTNGGSNFPTIDISPTNFNRYVVWMDDSNYPDSWELFFRYKSPEMTSWSSLIVLPTYASCYQPKITVDRSGTAHLIYIRRAFGSAVLWYTSNTNPTDPQGWTQPISISGQTQIDFPFPKVISDNFGNVYVIWPNKSEDRADIFFRKKVNGIWSEIENISKTPGESLYPDVAVDKATGNFCAVWHERVNNVWQIYFKYFQNGQWSSSQNITNSSSHCMNPSVYVDDLGQVHVAYEGIVNGQFDIFYSGTGSAPPPIVYPPINVAVESKLGDSPNRKNNTITWEENPANEGIKVTNYSIYRKKADQSSSRWTLLATVGKSVRRYRDNDLPNNQRFNYTLSTVAEGGQESAGSEEVTDEIVYPPIYPPINPAVESKLAESLTKKNNTLTWQRNPENENNAVKSYKIYRKRVEQSSKEFALAATVSPNTLQYEDKGLPNDQRFTYVLTTVATWDRESLYSAAITDSAVYPPTYPPLDVSLQSKLDGSETRKINIITWKANPNNKNLPLKNYRIYRREAGPGDENLVLLAPVSMDTYRYEDKNLPTTKKFLYTLTVVPRWEIESEKAVPAYEEWVFPPLDVTLETKVNDSLFFDEKINTVKWKRNPLNDASTITNYVLYRKKAGQSDLDYMGQVKLNSDVFEYIDRGLPLADKFVYALSAVDQVGNESKKSQPAGEK